MNWREKYKDKIVTAEEAVSHIKSGDKIISQQTHMCAPVSYTHLRAQETQSDLVFRLFL